MKRFLKALAVLSVTLMLVVGCAVGLHSLKPGVDIETIFKVVDTMPVDKEGWKLMSVPAKDFATSGIKYVFVRNDLLGTYGYGIFGNDSALLIIYDGATEKWSFCQLPFCWFITEADVAKLEQEFLKLFYENGDFSKVSGTLQVRELKEI